MFDPSQFDYGPGFAYDARTDSVVNTSPQQSAALEAKRKEMATGNYLQLRGFETDPKTGLPINVDRDAAFKNIRDELQNQYDNLVSYDPKLAYRGRSSDLPRIFDQQANQLAGAGVVTVTSLRNVNGKLVDIYQVDGMKDKVITTTNLRGQIATDRDTGAVKWGDIFSGVKGGANYGISFDPSGSPIFYPVYEKSKSPIAQIGLGGLESVIVPLLTIGGAFIGVPGLGAIGGAAAGAAAGNTTGQLLAAGKVDWEQVAKSAAVAAAGQAVFGGAGGEPTGVEAGGADYSLTGGGADVGGTGFQVPGGEVTGINLSPDIASEGFRATAGSLAPGLGTSIVPVNLGLGAQDYGLLGGTSPDQLATIGETGLLPGTGGEGLQLPQVPALPGMGGGQGLVVPVEGGFVTETGFTPIGATPSLGDPKSFINDPEVLGQPVIQDIPVAPTIVNTGTVLAGSAVLGALAPPPEEPPGEAPRVYEPRGFDVRLSNVAPIDVAGTPVSTINFSGATPVEAGGLAAPRGLGSLINIPTYAPTLTYAPMTEGQAMESVYLLPPELVAEGNSVAPVTPMREGGLAAVAQELASKGRGGDTMLAHITPEEAGLLKALGGAGTINPETGLPEFLKIGGIDLNPRRGIKLNLGPLGNVKVGRKSSDLLLAAGAGYAGATGIAGLTPASAGIYYGGFRGLASGNLMEGIQAGLSAYGMGEGFQAAGVGAPAGPTGPAPTALGSDLSGGTASVDAGVVGSQQVASPMITPYGDVSLASSYSGPMPTELEPFMQGGQLPGPEIITPTPTGGFYGKMPLDAGTAATQAGTEAAKPGFLARNLPAGVQKYIADPILDASGMTLAAGTVLGSSVLSGQQEREAFARQQADAERKRREQLGIYEDLAQRTMGGIRMARAGGLMNLAGGGMTYMEAGGTTGPTGIPRDVTGTGDGMSDSVPATIEGVQEARLADGEFVIPADVVADIGNGSSNAGSKKLYDMMDRIRKARHGTTKQPPEINAERLMPV